MVEAVVNWVSITWMILPITLLLLVVIILRQLAMRGSTHQQPLTQTPMWQPSVDAYCAMKPIDMTQYLTTTARCPTRIYHDHHD
jgi:hypothetical protein